MPTPASVLHVHLVHSLMAAPSIAAGALLATHLLVGQLHVLHALLVGTVHLPMFKKMERACNAQMAGHHCCQDQNDACPAQLVHILLLVELHVLHVKLGRSGILQLLPVQTARQDTILHQQERG